MKSVTLFKSLLLEISTDKAVMFLWFTAAKGAVFLDNAKT